MKKIYFNEQAVKTAIRGRQEYYTAINAFGEALAEEGIILTNEILAQFLSQGTGYVAGLLVQQEVNKFNKAGIPVSSLTEATFSQNAQGIASKFEKYRNPIRESQNRAHIGPDLVNIMEDGKAVFNDSEKKEIEQRNTYYLKKEDELLFEKLTELAGILNQSFMDLKKEHNLDLFQTLKSILSEGSYVQDRDMVFHPRPDVCLLLNLKGKIEPNPVIFS